MPCDPQIKGAGSPTGSSRQHGSAPSALLGGGPKAVLPSVEGPPWSSFSGPSSVDPQRQCLLSTGVVLRTYSHINSYTLHILCFKLASFSLALPHFLVPKMFN